MTLLNLFGFLAMIFILLIGMGLANLGSFIDFPSIQIVVGVSFLSLFATSSLINIKLLPQVLLGTVRPKNMEEAKPFIDMLESMSRVAMGAGGVGTIIGLILMLGNMSDVESIGPNMAVAMMCALYALILSELILQPLKNRLIAQVESEETAHEEDNHLPDRCGDPERKSFQKDRSHRRASDHSRWSVMLFSVLVPILAFFVLFVSMADINPGKVDSLSQTSQ